MRVVLLSLLSIIFTSFCAFAQNTGQVEMADGLRASGMIYVVVAVIAVIILGMLIFLFGMDKRISKIEKSISNKN
jgi:amino acid transporter